MKRRKMNGGMNLARFRHTLVCSLMSLEMSCNVNSFTNPFIDCSCNYYSPDPSCLSRLLLLKPLVQTWQNIVLSILLSTYTVANALS